MRAQIACPVTPAHLAFSEDITILAMNKSIDQALASLLPTLNAPPTALLNLSASLLAQSRTKAGNLKSEEEIARTYACAHLACER